MEGMDDLDKLPSFDAGATPRRSTSSLDAMSRVLIWLSRKSAASIFAVTLAALVLGTVLGLDRFPWPLRAAGAVLSTTVIFGYPFVLVFGFPAPYSSVTSRRISILAILAVVTACIASVTDIHSAPQAVDTWPGRLCGLLFGALIFSPFFVATHVLGQVRRALGAYKPLDSIGAWISLVYFGLGGVFFLHHIVANATETVLAGASTDKGCIFDGLRRGSMIEIKCLRLTLVKPRVAQPHR